MVQDSYAVGEGDGVVIVCAQLTGPAGGAEVGVIAEALLQDISKAGTYVDTKMKFSGPIGIIMAFSKSMLVPVFLKASLRLPTQFYCCSHANFNTIVYKLV